MFGKNKVTKPFQQQYTETGTFLVNSMFHTVQGEGPDAGTPAFFVRFAKCLLRCFFCDTEFEKYEECRLEDLARAWRNVPEGRSLPRLIVLTGGEPLLQDITPIVDMFNTMGCYVSVETAGVTTLDGLSDYFDRNRSIRNNLLVVSPKTPKIHKDIEQCMGALKYIISEGNIGNDGLPVFSTQIKGKRSAIYRKPKDLDVPVYVQPMDQHDTNSDEDFFRQQKREIEWAAHIAMKYGYRMSVQLHKLAGLP